MIERTRQNQLVDIEHPNREFLDQVEMLLEDNGLRTLRFIGSAHFLASVEDEENLIPDLLAYCVREILTSIPGKSKYSQGVANNESLKKVFEVTERLQMNSNQDLNEKKLEIEELLSRISNLKKERQLKRDFREENLEQFAMRNSGSMIRREVLRKYKELLDQANVGLHVGISREESLALYVDSLDHFEGIFTPFRSRSSRLEELGALQNPSEDERNEAIRLTPNANHLRYFISLVRSDAWILALDALQIFLLTENEDYWIGVQLAKHFSTHNLGLVVEILSREYQRQGRASGRSAYQILLAVRELKEQGAPLALQILNDFDDDSSIVHLSMQFANSETLSESEQFSFLNILLNRVNFDRDEYGVAQFLENSARVTSPNDLMSRLNLLVNKMGDPQDDTSFSYYLKYDRSGSISDMDEFYTKGFEGLIFRAIMDVCKKLCACQSPLNEILIVLSRLPSWVNERLEVWIRTLHPSPLNDESIARISRGISTGYPNGDQKLLVDRISRELSRNIYTPIWTEEVLSKSGELPALTADSLREDPAIFRAMRDWITLLPLEMDEELSQYKADIESHLGVFDVASLTISRNMPINFNPVRGPLHFEDMRDLPILQACAVFAAWEPNPDEWIVSKGTVAQEIPLLLEANLSGWLADPLGICDTLKDPTYVYIYLITLTNHLKNSNLNLVDLMRLLIRYEESNWFLDSATPLELFDRDDWSDVRYAFSQLFKLSANQDVGFSDQQDVVVEFLIKEIYRGSNPVGELGTSFSILQDAINRHPTVALDALLSVLRWESRKGLVLRIDVYRVLDDLLQNRVGRDGAQFRSIIAMNLNYIKFANAEWVNDNSKFLFGSQLPDGLGEVTVNLVLTWCSPQEWFLKKFIKRIWFHAKSGDERAINFYLLGCLWEIRRYKLSIFLERDQHGEDIFKKAVENLTRLLRPAETDPIYIRKLIGFWQDCLAQVEGPRLSVFGWCSEIAGLADGEWLELTLATLKKTGNKIQWSNGVADRIDGIEPSSMSVEILYRLVRENQSDFGSYRVKEVAKKVVQIQDLEDSIPEVIKLKDALDERDN